MPDQSWRDEGILTSLLDDSKKQKAGDSQGRERENDWRRPGDFVATDTQSEKKRCGRSDEDACSGIVQSTEARPRGRRHPQRNGCGAQPQRNVDQKIARQPRCCERMPPMTGPSVLARAKLAPNHPWNLPLSFGETTSPISACARVIRPPPPKPCSARAQTRTERLGAIAHAAEPPTNSPSAQISMRFRPNASPMRP